MSDLASISSLFAGRFLAFEGADGSGKSTQLKRFVDALAAAGLTVCEVREPGGTAIGEEIRKVLLHTKEEMTLHCEMLLYMASRAQLVEQRILPALAAGHVVIADRFLSSTIAYQGAGGGVPVEDILAVGKAATRGRLPDLIIIFDVDKETAARRTRGVQAPKTKRRSTATAGAPSVTLFDDRIEQRGDDFHSRVRQSYLDQAAAEPARHLVIDARPDPETVWKSLVSAVSARLKAI
ncbi:MAG: dTMP kinase [Tepidisphaera sp.]